MLALIKPLVLTSLKSKKFKIFVVQLLEKLVGKSKDGVPLSEFEYKDKEDAPSGPGRYKGVVAQDLVGTEHEDAVKNIDKNTLGVNYGKLDIILK